ncbi:MAG: hypothetical protein Q4A60_09310 [Pasteurellaceae bacterium]|nr:hypothetical protein [Pasteurellaceae bacterium]
MADDKFNNIMNELYLENGINEKEVLKSTTGLVLSNPKKINDSPTSGVERAIVSVFGSSHDKQMQKIRDEAERESLRSSLGKAVKVQSGILDMQGAVILERTRKEVNRRLDDMRIEELNDKTNKIINVTTDSDAKISQVLDSDSLSEASKRELCRRIHRMREKCLDSVDSGVDFEKID